MKKPQQLHLQSQRHLPDLVQEQRAAVGILDLPLHLPMGARKRALLVTEQLTLQQVFRNRSAIDGNEWAVLAGRAAMDGARNEFLAGAAVSHDQDGDIGIRHAPDHFENAMHRRAHADDLIKPRRTRPFLKRPVLLLQAVEIDGAL